MLHCLELTKVSHSYVIDSCSRRVNCDAFSLEQLPKFAHGKSGKMNVPLIYLSGKQLSVNCGRWIFRENFSSRPLQRGNKYVNLSAFFQASNPVCKDFVSLPVAKVFQYM